MEGWFGVTYFLNPMKKTKCLVEFKKSVQRVWLRSSLHYNVSCGTFFVNWFYVKNGLDMRLLHKSREWSIPKC